MKIMAKIIKKFISYTFRPQNIIVSLYIILILSTTLVLKFDFSNEMQILLFLRSLFLKVLFVFPIVSIISILINKFEIKQKTNIKKLTEKELVLFRILFFIIPLIIFLIYFYASYPGGFSNDTLNQYYQSLNNKYNDWHPVIHTLIFYKIPMIITNNYISSMVLFQILICSLIHGYVFFTIYKYTSLKYTIISMLFILLNPNICNIMMYSFKDVAFGYNALLLITILINSIYTNHKYLENKFIFILFVIILSLTTLYRHNGFLFTLPFLLSLLFFLPFKLIKRVFVYSALIILFIIFPLYSLLKVEKRKSSIDELLGIPLNVISAVTKYDYSDKLLDEYEIIYSIAPYDSWNNYEYGNYNLVKYHQYNNKDIINDLGANKIFDIAHKCFKTSPYISIKSIIKLTNPVYSIDDDFFYPTLIDIAPNNYGINYSGNSNLKNALFYYLVFILTFFFFFFLYIGFMHLILIASSILKFKSKNRSSISLLLIILPIFTYNLGTMLLMTDCHDMSRFFHYVFLIMPIVVMYMFSPKTPKSY